ncbi:MAG: YbjN domain-containing protein [Brevundimonas sp.]|jgi:hypothetical protein|uniref:YbjN domain-containing protein n=1 Tax=Brevundimonas sp. TaxID=1871086 RepID=UPI00391C165D
MTLRPALLSALFLAGLALPAAAQEGLSVADTRAWLISVGAEVGEPVVDADGKHLQVRDGPLNWRLAFPGCTTAVCGDAQFSARFTAPGATAEAVAAWNRDQRFLKAWAADGAATVQYDLILDAGEPNAVLGTPTALWVEGVRRFAVHVGFAVPAP